MKMVLTWLKQHIRFDRSSEELVCHRSWQWR